MIDIAPAGPAAPPRPPGLQSETKTGWVPGVLATAQRFIHCSTKDLRACGIDPLRSGEWVVDPNGNPILGGRLVFAFPCLGMDGQPAVPPPVKTFGMARFMYVFTAQPGIRFACQGGDFGGGPANLQTGKEVAFPYQIEVTDFIAYDIQPPAPVADPPCCGRSACCIIL